MYTAASTLGLKNVWSIGLQDPGNTVHRGVSAVYAADCLADWDLLQLASTDQYHYTKIKTKSIVSTACLLLFHHHRIENSQVKSLLSQGASAGPHSRQLIWAESHQDCSGQGNSSLQINAATSEASWPGVLLPWLKPGIQFCDPFFPRHTGVHTPFWWEWTQQTSN